MDRVQIRPELLCKQCKKFLRKDQVKNGVKFCSKRCLGDSMRGVKHPENGEKIKAGQKAMSLEAKVRWRANQSSAQSKGPWTEEHKAQHVANNPEKRQEWISNISVSTTGVSRPKPEGFGAKVSAAQTGVPKPAGTGAKIAARLKENTEFSNIVSRARLAQNGTGNYLDFNNDRRFSIWRIEVLTRDSFRCLRCGISELQWKEKQKLAGKEPQGLHAHHINGRIKYVELRFAVENGITLCASCHNIVEPKFEYNPDSEFVEVPLVSDKLKAYLKL